ncbi:MAG: HAMP domain-containing sensor histidine kinase [Bdellovibrionota bacterium]
MRTNQSDAGEEGGLGMKPIRLKLNLIILALGVVSLGLAYVGFHIYSQIELTHKAMHMTIEARQLLENLPNKKISDEYTKILQEFRASLYPEQRKVLFSDIIQAYTSNKKNLLSNRIDNYYEQEKVHYKNMKAQLAYYEKKLIFYSIVLFCSVLGLLVTLKLFTQSQIFVPLQSTTNRMADFLNGKYSYNFDSPDENEMGELQATFNSMAQEVLKNMEELKALDSAKSDFLNIASHELRTPMTSIKGSLSLISSGVMGDVSDEILNLIRIAELETDRLVRLINDILDMAKIDARKLPLKLTWTPLHELLDKTVMSLQGLAQTFDVKIVKQDFENIAINVDADRIQQVITNLVSNAVKFSPKNNMVELLVDVKANAPVKIMVKDHGKGMTPQEKSILFQKFRQVSSPDNPLVKGTGLGLAIAKALVEEHNGQIDVTTKPNEGSTFYFTIPEWKHLESISQEKLAA